MSAMGVLDMIRAKRDEVLAIAKEHKAEKLWVFGSCARGEETAESDVDLLVKWSPGEYSWKDECALRELFMKFFGRPVDIVANTALRRNPRFAQRVCPEAIAI